MTNSPNRDRNLQNLSNQRFWLMMLSRGGIALGGLLVIGIIAGSWRLWSFVQKDLAPLAQQGITTSLNRPVKLGKLKDFSFSGVSFDASEIPPTPQDPDSATVETVDVSFDILQLLFQRRLKLDVTLVNPNVYVEQDTQGRWLGLKIQPPRKGALIKTDVDKLRFRNGTLVLAASRTRGTQTSGLSPALTKVSFSSLNGVAQLLENNQLIKYEVAGKPTNGGSIFIRGETRPKTRTDNLDLQVDDLLAADVTNILRLPVQLQKGRVKGDLRVEAEGEQPPLLFGNASVQGLQVQVARMPRPFVNGQGKISFEKTALNLDNVTTNYGKVPLIARGTIDRKAGFNLAARVNTASAANVQETLKINLPVPVIADLNADLLVTGEIDNPLVSGKASSIKTAKIDKVDFESVGAKFEFATRAGLISFKDIQGKTAVGGEITGTGLVQVGVNPQVNFNLTAKNVPGDAIAQVYNISPNFQIGNITATAQLTGTPGTVRTNVQWQAPNATYPGTGETIVNPDRSVSFRNVALNVAGGKVIAAGNWVNQQWQVTADTSSIPVKQFVNQEQLQNVTLDGVNFDGRLLISGNTAPFKINGIQSQNAGINIGGGRVALDKVKFDDKYFAAALVANNVRLSRVLKKSAPVLQNPLAGKFIIAGSRDDITLKTIEGSGDARLSVGGGRVDVNNIQLRDGNYQAQLKISDSNIQELAQVPPQVQGRVTGGFKVAGNVDSFELPAIQAKGQARLNVDGGSFNASNIVLDRGRYQAAVQAVNVRLQRYAKVPTQVQGGLNGQFNVAGTVDSFKPENVQLTGVAKLNVAGGTVTASNIQLNNGNYRAIVDSSGVELNRVNPQLQGKFASQLQVTGNVSNPNLANLAAVGQVQFSQGLAGIEQPLTANIGWNGERLVVENAKSRDVTASGYITVNAKGAGTPEITGLNLNVLAKNYSLQNLPTKLPSAIALSGKADFNGKITGNLSVPNLQGQVALRDLVVNKLAFESLLSGNLTTQRGSGLQLDVTGKQDRIALKLDANNRPNNFLVNWRGATATGEARGENLIAKVDNLPLTALNLTPPSNPLMGTGGIGGLLTGDFQLNQKTFATVGKIAIANPQVGNIKGNSLNATFDYSNGKLTLTDSSFIKNKSTYAFAGSIIATAKTPQIQGKFTATQGDIQDILTTLQIFEIQDFQRGINPPTYGSAADLSNTQPAALPNQNSLAQIQQSLPVKQPLNDKLLWFQFHRFSELSALSEKQQQQRRDASPIPDLADLKGTFNAEVSFNTAAANGLIADFKINGQDFIWGRKDDLNRYFQAQQIIAQGNFNDGVLRLQPLRVESKNRLFSFAGSIGGKEQSGTLRVTNFPVEVLGNFVKLPVGLTGNLSGQAAIAGSITNPQAKGDLSVSEGTLNAKGVQSADASFNYADGRLNFNSNVNVTNADPVSITGNIPYRFPLATTSPDSNQLSLDVKIKNQGLAVINLLTNQLAFEKGEGEVDLQVRGTPTELILNGIANINNATFSAQALPGKLTDVVGQVKFDFDRIIVENIEGKFSRGKVEAFGEIPISDKQLQIINPLTINLDKLALNLKGLYQGGVSGNVQVTGSALDPLIGGDIKLSDGKVLLAESTTNKQEQGRSLGKIKLKADKKFSQETETDETSDETPTRFNNLLLTLGNNVRITRPPILDFLATGSLTLSGSFTDPIPKGEIRLREGGVNLFTTRFNLARGYEHKAIFETSQPRDPQLDIRLFAKVLDGVQSSDFSARVIDGVQTSDLSRINTTGLTALESIRVEASIQGVASQLNNNLELKSDPARSQNEIVALLGGGFVDTQGRGSGSTLGLINIAGSAVFNNFQSAFNDVATAFGLSEFRLFPTIISEDPEAGRNFSSLQLAAEAGVDISPRVSASALKILTASDPVQWGINYRINKEFRFRASTNLFDENRAVVEFERRF